MHSTSTILLDTQATSSKAVAYSEPLSSASLQASIANYGIIMAPNEAAQKTSSNITYNSVSPLILEPPAVNMNATPSAESVRKTLATDEGDIVAEAYQILRLIHEIFVEMRRLAAESRQDDYLDQWTALDRKANEMENAAGKDLGAGLAGGAFGVIGGAAGLYAGTMAMKHTKLAQKEAGADLPQAPGRPDLATTNPGGPGTQGIKPNGTNTATNPNSNSSVIDDLIEDAPAPQQPQQAANDPDNAPLPPADHNPNPAGIDPAPGAPQQNPKVKFHESQAQTYSSLSMVVGQSIIAMGAFVSSPLKFVADIARTESQREDAEAVKAQAGAERESEFWRTTSEGSKSALDTTTQLVTSRHEISNKIWS